MIQGQTWREQEFLLICQKSPCNLCSHCQNKFTSSFGSEDFPTDLKTKSKTGDRNMEDWQKTRKKQLEVDSRRKGDGKRLQVFSGCEVLKKS